MKRKPKMSTRTMLTEHHIRALADAGDENGLRMRWSF